MYCPIRNERIIISPNNYYGFVCLLHVYCNELLYNNVMF